MKLTVFLCLVPILGCGLALNPIEAKSNFYNYATLKSGQSFSTDDSCRRISVSISLRNDAIILNANGKTLKADAEGEESDLDLIIGDFWRNNRCFIAVQNAESGANESYALYDASAQKNTIRRVESLELTNPDFVNDRVINSYRDAARMHTETLCFGQSSGTPYVCRKAELLNDSLEKSENCTESGECTSSGLVDRRSHKPVKAKISAQKAFALEKTGSTFDRTGAYLIQNDIIRIMDFDDQGPKLHYFFVYHGKSNTTTGWLKADDLVLLDQ